VRPPTPRRSRSRPRSTCPGASPRRSPPGAPGSVRARSRSHSHGRAPRAGSDGSASRASISSSSSSEIFVPSREKNLMPLSSGGLCDAEITTPRRRVKLGRQERDRRGRLHPGEDHVASRRSDAVRQRLLEPDPERRVSRPTRNVGRSAPCRPSTTTAARPRPKASSCVSSVPATPRTPSVPKSRPTAARLPEPADPVPRDRARVGVSADDR